MMIRCVRCGGRGAAWGPGLELRSDQRNDGGEGLEDPSGISWIVAVELGEPVSQLLVVFDHGRSLQKQRARRPGFVGSSELRGTEPNLRR